MHIKSPTTHVQAARQDSFCMAPMYMHSNMVFQMRINSWSITLGTHGFLVFINDFRDFLVLRYSRLKRRPLYLGNGKACFISIFFLAFTFFFDYKSTTNGVEGGYMLFTVSQSSNFIPLEKGGTLY
jgi:hypothetical protein